MNDFKELTHEIKDALIKDDFEMLQILVDGETMSSLEAIKEELHDPHLIAKFHSYLKEYEKMNDEEEKDKIRKINSANSNEYEMESDSENNEIFEEIRKKAKSIKLEERFGYSYYGNVKCLMIAYGDLYPSEQSIKMMHSQLEVLRSEIFKNVYGLKWKSIHMRNYLSKIFPEEFENYYTFKKMYKKASSRSLKDKNLSDDDSDFFGSDDNDDSTDNFSKKSNHMIMTTNEEKEYFFSLTSQMNIIEYEKYSQCRMVNFIQNSKFPANVAKIMKFIDPDSQLSQSIFDLGLVSFLMCRIVRKIVFRTIRSRSNGKLIRLNSSIQADEIKRIGNEVISEYEQIFSAFFTSVSEEAMKLFIEEFRSEQYYDLMPRSITKGRKKVEDALDIWKECKHYQKMWEERILAEKEVNEYYDKLEDGSKDPEYEYSKFILKNYRVYRQMGKSHLWKNYFLQANPDDPQPKPGVSRKRKLESIKK